MADNEPRVPFKKAVLALNGGPTDDLVVHLGCQLAKGSGAELIAVHVIEVDWSQELSAELPEKNETASALLDFAEGIAEGYKVKLTGDLLQAREVAAALVDEAVEVGADAIIVGLPYRQRFGGDFAIGDAIPYIFQNAPCQVIVVRERVADSADRQSVGGPTSEAETSSSGAGDAASGDAKTGRSRRSLIPALSGRR